MSLGCYKFESLSVEWGRNRSLLMEKVMAKEDEMHQKISCFQNVSQLDAELGLVI